MYKLKEMMIKHKLLSIEVDNRHRDLIQEVFLMGIQLGQTELKKENHEHRTKDSGARSVA